MAWEPDYITSDELKTEVRIPLTDTQDDALIARVITSASRSVDLYTKRQYGATATAEARYYSPWFDEDLNRWVAYIDDIMTVAALAVAIDDDDDNTFSASLTSSEYVLLPRNAAQKSRPWTRISILNSAHSQPLRRPESLRITATYGWTSVPVTIKNATMLQASRYFDRRNSPYGVEGKPDNNSDQELLQELDPDVELMLKGYRRMVKP